MNFFAAEQVTLRELFQNEYNRIDKNKNFYIPRYQRKYKWADEHIQDFINDINDLYIDDANYSPYFLGGIVLSRESIDGDDRTNFSLEVIDGQQRLTTLSLIFAITAQSLKFSDRAYPGKNDFIHDLVDQISNLVVSKRYTIDYQVEKVLKVERSDKIQPLYEKIIKTLIDSKIDLEELNETIIDEDEKSFIQNVISIYERIDLMEDNRLLHFILQLLDHTQMVVTKTDNISTGYIIFEKLNDRGEGLNADDLLKNYLFSIKTDEDDTIELQKKWDKLVENIRQIVPNSKMSPKDFLEHFLIIKGLEYKSSSTSDIFKAYKNYFELPDINNDNFIKNLEKTALHYKTIRKNGAATEILTRMNFKLGFLIFLAFYDKYTSDDYSKYEGEILRTVFKFGYVLLLTGKTKPIRYIVTKKCKEIASSELGIKDTIAKLESDFHNLILERQEDFEVELSSTNRFNRAFFAQVLFDIINFHLGGSSKNSKLPLVHIMPEEYKYCRYEFEEIIDDNYKKYANYLGNLTILSRDNNKLCQSWEEDGRLECISKNSSLLINKTFYSIKESEISLTNKYVEFFIENSSTKNWGKSLIITRTEALTKIAVDIFIKGAFNVKYFD